MRVRKSVSEQPGCWTSCSVVCGVGFGYKHIPCLLLKLVGTASAGLSAIAHLYHGWIPGHGCPQDSVMNAAFHTKGLPAVAPSLSCLLVGALIPLWDSLL